MAGSAVVKATGPTAGGRSPQRRTAAACHARPSSGNAELQLGRDHGIHCRVLGLRTEGARGGAVPAFFVTKNARRRPLATADSLALQHQAGGARRRPYADNCISTDRDSHKRMLHSYFRLIV